MFRLNSPRFVITRYVTRYLVFSSRHIHGRINPEV